MLFNSYSFVIFFLAVLLISRMLGNWSLRKLFLLAVSYIFYAAWNPPFVLLLWVSTVVDWYAGKGLYASKSRLRRRLFLVVSLSVNLGMLTFFKYGSFLVGNLNALLSTFGLEANFGQPNIILPVGISFYTFQTLSYTIDIYRGRLRPWHSFLDYALYVTFFPQLVAGPIVRATEFLPQCQSPRSGSRSQIGWGMSLIVIGLFAKVVVADGLMAPIVEMIYDSGKSVGFLSAWAGTLAFANQIFCDFFGYSICAIGVALCLGFSLPDNFRWPYAAVGFSDFWGRWHISLSSWLRDYLYIPLGGNRKGVSRTFVNLSIIMLLGGLWHGASWMFVIWGGIHGTYLVAERFIRQTSLAAWTFWRTRIGEAFLIFLTFFLVCITWVFFRAKDMSEALSLVSDMVNLRQGVSFAAAKAGLTESFNMTDVMDITGTRYVLVFLVTLLQLALHYILRESSIKDVFSRLPWWVRSFLLATMVYIIAISMAGEDRAFIYFQF